MAGGGEAAAKADEREFVIADWEPTFGSSRFCELRPHSSEPRSSGLVKKTEPVLNRASRLFSTLTL